MATKMTAILDFSKNSNLSEKLGNCKYFFSGAVKYGTIKHFAAFGCVLYVFTPKNMHLYSKIARPHAYSVTIATDCRQNFTKMCLG